MIKKYHIIILSLIIIMALMCYSNTFHVPFQFDDLDSIVRNPHVHMDNLSLERMGKAANGIYIDSIRLFSFFTLAVNYYLGGLNVVGYHIVNLIIHIATGLLLYWFVFLTFNLPSLKNRYGFISHVIAAVSSLIFIAHPVHTQAVTYIVQRMASMAGMFYLLTFVLYIKGRLAKGRPRWAYFIGMGLSYILGIFTKENVAILPFFIVLYEFFFFQKLDLGPRGKRRALALLCILLTLGILGMAVWGGRYLSNIKDGYKYRTFTMQERLLTQPRVVMHYISLLAFPHPSRLNVDYDFPLSRSLINPITTLMAMIFIAGILAIATIKVRESPIFSFFTLWVFGNLVIESSVFPLEMVFEHRLYIPSMGPIILFAMTTAPWVKRYKMALAAVAIVIATFGFWTFERNHVWQSEESLWMDASIKSPGKDRPYNNLAASLMKHGRLRDALPYLQKASSLGGISQMETNNNIGIIMGEMGRYEEAFKYFDLALHPIYKGNWASIDVHPFLAQIENNIGLYKFRSGRIDEAIIHMREALRIEPGFELARGNFQNIIKEKMRREHENQHFKNH